MKSWQGVHARVQARQSFPTPGHKNRWDTNLTVVLAVGGVKDLTTEKCGYELPRLWGGCVTVNVDFRSGNWHPF